MTGEEKITQEKHPGRVTHGHKFAALMKKRKEEILKEQSTVTVFSTAFSTVYSTAKWRLYLWRWYCCCSCIFCL